MKSITFNASEGWRGLNRPTVPLPGIIIMEIGLLARELDAAASRARELADRNSTPESIASTLDAVADNLDSAVRILVRGSHERR